MRCWVPSTRCRVPRTLTFEKKMNAAGQSHTKVQRQHGFGNEREMKQPNSQNNASNKAFQVTAHKASPNLNADVRKSIITCVL